MEFDDTLHRRWQMQLEGIDLEIAREAIICGVPLLEPGVIERILKNDSAVCSQANSALFDKLRALLTMHFSVRQRAVESIGETEVQGLCHEIRQHLRNRIGNQLGGRRD